MVNVKALDVGQFWEIPDDPTSMRKYSAIHLIEGCFEIGLMFVLIPIL